MRPRLEVISTSPQDSKTIWATGADRIELVSALQIGGVTPPCALLRKSLEITGIPTMVMVRHHNLGFILDESQKELLVQEAVSLCEMGAQGLVVGAISPHKKVDSQFLTRLIGEISNKIDLTFHKASDQTNLIQTYETLKALDIRRVLTQGGKGPISANAAVIKELMKVQSVTTLLGGGINLENIGEIVKEFNPAEVHIGTCVRKGKFGQVSGQLLGEFISKLKVE